MKKLKKIKKLIKKVYTFLKECNDSAEGCYPGNIPF